MTNSERDELLLSIYQTQKETQKDVQELKQIVGNHDKQIQGIQIKIQEIIDSQKASDNLLTAVYRKQLDMEQDVQEIKQTVQRLEKQDQKNEEDHQEIEKQLKLQDARYHQQETHLTFHDFMLERQKEQISYLVKSQIIYS
jgi:chromosome segregation ATPase